MSNIISKEAVVNRIQFELLNLNKAYDVLYRKAQKIEMLLDDKIIPTGKGIVYDEVVNNLTNKILTLGTSETKLLSEITRINGVNKDYMQRLDSAKKDIVGIEYAIMQQKNKYRRNVNIAIVIIIILISIVIYLLCDMF